MERPEISTHFEHSASDLNSESDDAEAWCPGDGICRHPWIVDPFRFSDQYDPPVEAKKECLDRQGILKWAAEVQSHY
jgi:hypothetical protein